MRRSTQSSQYDYVQPANNIVPGVPLTICDVSGFKTHLNKTMKRWDKFQTLPFAHHPRQPQDYQIRPTPQKVFPLSKFETVEAPLPPAFDPDDWVTDP